MSRAARDWAWAQELDANEKIVLLYLAERADDAGLCFPKVETVSAATRLSVRAVQRQLRRLEAGGLVATEVVHGRGRVNEYQLKVPPASPITAEKGVTSVTYQREEKVPIGAEKVPPLTRKVTPASPPVVTVTPTVKQPSESTRGLLSQARRESPSTEESASQVRASPKPNRLAQVLDLLTAAGITARVSGRDGAAIKHSSAPPELVARAYAAAYHGEWPPDDFWLRDHLALYAVVERIGGFEAWERDSAQGSGHENTRHGTPRGYRGSARGARVGGACAVGADPFAGFSRSSDAQDGIGPASPAGPPGA